MGTAYVWVCDKRREYIDPYPLDAPHLYTWMRVGVTHGVNGEVTEGWYGETIRLLSDCGGSNDEYYLRTGEPANAHVWGGTENDVYRNVTADALNEASEWYEKTKWWNDPKKGHDNGQAE